MLLKVIPVSLPAFEHLFRIVRSSLLQCLCLWTLPRGGNAERRPTPAVRINGLNEGAPQPFRFRTGFLGHRAETQCYRGHPAQRDVGQVLVTIVTGSELDSDSRAGA